MGSKDCKASSSSRSRPVFTKETASSNSGTVLFYLFSAKLQLNDQQPLIKVLLRYSIVVSPAPKHPRIKRWLAQPSPK